jgi:predicted polyphosphate/ATP-dependent NAD kinase
MDEKSILELLERHPDARIIVSPIGAQGFVFGRGNQQISPDVLRKIGKENVIIVSTPGKMASTPELHIYTGDRELDDSFRGYVRVLTGYGRWKMKKLI